MRSAISRRRPEAIGYQGLAAPDHVLGAKRCEPAGAGRRGRGPLDRPLSRPRSVLFGFLAGITKIADFFDPGADIAATPDGAGRQAGGLP